MIQYLVILALIGGSYQQLACRTPTMAAVNNMCATGYTLISPGNCCKSTDCYQCADVLNSKGQNECPSMISYCNNSLYNTLMRQQCAKTCGFCSSTPVPTTPSTCRDQTKANGQSDCAQNANLCNNSLYRDMMRQQCPKTCGYCR